MTERKRSIMDDIRKTSEEVSNHPSYLRTQSSVARAERDMQRTGIDPRFGRVGSPAVSEQIQSAEPITPDSDYSTESFRFDISGK